MYLYINIASRENVEISIVGSGFKEINKAGFSCEYQFQIKDRLLKEIDKILVKNKIVLKDLNGIIAVNKSKEMTSLRIGISVANALAYSLNIPAVGIENPDQLSLAFKSFKKIKKFRLVKPKYEINPMLKK
ncbi:MAG: hypothetical protein ABIC82_05040 [bacterium]